MSRRDDIAVLKLTLDEQILLLEKIQGVARRQDILNVRLFIAGQVALLRQKRARLEVGK